MLDHQLCAPLQGESPLPKPRLVQIHTSRFRGVCGPRTHTASRAKSPECVHLSAWVWTCSPSQWGPGHATHGCTQPSMDAGAPALA